MHLFEANILPLDKDFLKTYLTYYFSPCRVYLTHYGISGAPEQSVCGILFLFYSQFLDNGDQVHSDQVLFELALDPCQPVTAGLQYLDLQKNRTEKNKDVWIS